MEIDYYILELLSIPLQLNSGLYLLCRINFMDFFKTPFEAVLQLLMLYLFSSCFIIDPQDGIGRLSA